MKKISIIHIYLITGDHFWHYIETYRTEGGFLYLTVYNTGDEHLQELRQKPETFQTFLQAYNLNTISNFLIDDLPILKY